MCGETIQSSPRLPVGRRPWVAQQLSFARRLAGGTGAGPQPSPPEARIFMGEPVATTRILRSRHERQPATDPTSPQTRAATVRESLLPPAAPTDRRPLELVACCPGAAGLLVFKRRFKKGRSGRRKAGPTLGMGAYGPIVAPLSILQPQLLNERARRSLERRRTGYRIVRPRPPQTRR